MSRSPAWVGHAVAAVALVAGVAGTASGDTVAAQAGADAGSFIQASADETALLEYFTFVPQAIVLLIAVGLRRYALDDEDIPWWLDGDALRERVDRLVPTFGRRPMRGDGDDERADSETKTAGPTRSESGQTGPDAETDGAQSSTASGSSASRQTDSESTARRARERDDTVSTDTGSSTTSGRTSGPVPDRLALSYGDQRIVVRDGDTVDEEIRAMLRAAGEGEHAKWIDDRHLHFIGDEHGFTLVVDGENPTRLNGERLRPGDRDRVYPGDDIELSGVVTLSVERA